VIAWAILFACFVNPTFANTQLFEEAKRLIAGMNVKQAYMLLIAEQDKLIGNVEYDYLLGVAALDSGKIDESIIAFERVLAIQPRNAGAQLDLARAYYTAGSLDLAEGTFRKLRALSPPAAAMDAIDKYLAAIEARRIAARRQLAMWTETTLGYDTNLTGVPNDFTSAVQQAFNLAGVLPTGNSLKRKAPYLGAAIGADFLFPLSASWNGYLGGDVRGRGYRKEAPFNSGTADTRAGAIWERGIHQVRLNSGYNAFWQKGDAPGDPKPTNDRRAATASTEYRLSLTGSTQLTLGLTGVQTRFVTNNTEDFNSSVGSLSMLNAWSMKGSPITQLTLFRSNDRAVRKLADGVTDKSKQLTGLRVFVQFSANDRLSFFQSIGATDRVDKFGFARATTVEFGKDVLGDVTLGVNWRFRQGCGMRAQWFASRNRSNIAIYEFTRQEASSTIRCEI
jgi:hypothetical protein